MRDSRVFTICVMAVLASGLLAGSAEAQADGNSRMSVTVSFGVGLNTAQPGNAANHHVLPRTIEVKAGGVVNFVVAGLHQIFVYQPGMRPEDIVVPPAPAFFINDLLNLYYQGIVPAGGPPATPVTTNPSNAVNRVEANTWASTHRVPCHTTARLL